MVDPALLTRYLRQLAELGGDAIYLDLMRAEELIEALRGEGAGLARAAVPVPTSSRLGEESDAGQPVPTDAGWAETSSVDTVRVTEARGRSAPALLPLAEEAAGCVRCRLHEGRRTVVFGEGAEDARLVVVGEAPGYEEDRTGRPFVGPAGRMLDLLLMSGGFPRANVYICNVLKCRPPKNRDPLPDEVTICTSAFLRPQLETIAPRALLAVGKFAAQSLAGSDESIGRMRGRLHSYRGIPLVVTYHPAFLLRTPSMARAAWEDVQLVRKVLDEQA